jgi:hypothetical protein
MFKFCSKVERQCKKLQSKLFENDTEHTECSK